MKQNTDISVVMPLYNKEKTIERALKSVIRQTLQPNEIIIVDDGSTDKSADYVEKIINDFSEHCITIKLIKKSNNGVSSARNLGCTNSTNQFVAFLDADDEWKSNHLETIEKLIKSTPNANLYFTGFEISTSKGQLAPKLGLDYNHFGVVESYIKSTIQGKTANSSNSCIRKDKLLEIGGFPVGVTAGEDLFVWIQLAMNGIVSGTTLRTVTIHHDETHLNGKRLTSVPYPLTYFSTKKNLFNNHPDLKKLLAKIGDRHLIYSIIKGNLKGSINRWMALRSISPFLAAQRAPLFFLIPIFHILNTIRIKFNF